MYELSRKVGNYLATLRSNP